MLLGAPDWLVMSISCVIRHIQTIMSTRAAPQDSAVVPQTCSSLRGTKLSFWVLFSTRCCSFHKCVGICGYFRCARTPPGLIPYVFSVSSVFQDTLCLGLSWALLVLQVWLISLTPVPIYLPCDWFFCWPWWVNTSQAGSFLLQYQLSWIIQAFNDKVPLFL